MKKIIVLLFAFFAINTSSQAQQFFAGTITINNNTDCEIAWNVTACCANECPALTSSFDSGAMNFLSAGGTVTYSQTTYPWNPVAPVCGSFAWRYVDIAVECESGYENKRLEISECGYHGSQITYSCTCNGQTVYADWSAVSGNVTVDVHY